MDNMFRALVLITLFGWVAAQPIPKTGWQTLNERPAGDRSYPRVAAFSGGEYAVVYAVANDVENSQIAVKIFYQNGATKVPEKILSTLQGINYAPNIMIVNDVAIVVWRHSTVLVVSNSLFLSNGTVLASYSTTLDKGAVNTEDMFGLFSVNNSFVYGVALTPTASTTSTLALFQSIGVALVNTPYISTTAVVDIPSVIYDPRNNASYWFETTADATRFSAKKGFEGQQTIIEGRLPASKYYPFLIESTSVLPVVRYDRISAVSLQVLDTSTLTVKFQRDLFNTSQARKGSTDVLYLGSSYALVAQTGKNVNMEYRFIKISENSVDFIGPILTDEPSTSDGVSMAKIGNDIVVAAYNPTRSQVMTRVLSFCGNGVLDFSEDCDGHSSCTSLCQCRPGTVPRKGQCEDSCGNFIVTGNEDCDDGTDSCNPDSCKCQPGYLPSVLDKKCIPVPADYVPKVGPSLDCLKIDGDLVQLFFSFVSTDPFDQRIEFGKMNYFIPDEFATGRPSFFKAGTTLTYPVSPYNLTVFNVLHQFTWLLGPYNLTVDISPDKVAALQCPKNAGFILTVATFDTLTDTDVKLLLANMAARYNISIDRLEATYRLSAAGSTIEPNIYSILITILSSTNPLDPDAHEVFKDLYSDLVDAKEELVSDLTRGLDEKNPQIKDVTPLPTGVEVRSQERDDEPVVFVPTATSSSLASAPFALCTLLASLISFL